MEERTAEEIAAIFAAAGDSVTVINADANYAAFVSRTGLPETESTWKQMIERNVAHLELIKTYKNLMVQHLSGHLKILQP